MDRAAAQGLLDRVGPSLPDLVQEIGKLVLYVKDRPAILLDDVDACGGARATLRLWNGNGSSGGRDRKKALSVLDMLRTNGEPVEKLLPQLSRAIQKLCLGKALFNENTLGKKQVFDRLWIRLQDAPNGF
jgi:DNA polymerase III delta subunit